jgi:nodulation protein E
MCRSVVITGLGCISALGHNVTEFWNAIQEGYSGIGPLQNISMERMTTPIGAEVKDFVPEEHISARELSFFDRFSQLAFVATKEAIHDSTLEKSQLRSAAVVLGTSCGAEKTYEETYERLYVQGKSRAHPLTVPKAMHSAAVSQISMYHGITGPVFTVSSACSSAAHSIIQAVQMIRSGLVDVAIAGGAEAPFSFGLMKAWEGLKVLSHDTCRPFSVNRSGLVMGEGAGMVVLESLEHAENRQANIYCELAGFGMSSDAGHITAPSVDGASRAIEAALLDAKLSTNEIDYINAHGTGTQANDVTETAAINRVFDKHAAKLAISSTKSMHGHPLGASGGLELIATVKAMQDGVVPPTANFTEAGEGCNLDYVPNDARDMEINAAISNSFAFGGLNAVLVVRLLAKSQS